jgi:ribosomal protein L37AE/L43A
VLEDDSEHHEVEIVQRDRRSKGDDAAYWRCNCGHSAGGRWYRSTQEATKAAKRHVERAVN